MWKYLLNNVTTPSTSGYQFKMQHSFDKRKDESSRLKEKHPDKIPIILEKAGDVSLPSIDKQKFLMQSNVTIGQFLYIIRSKIKLDASQSLFLFIDNSHIPTTSISIGEVFEKYGDQDGFLYMTYSAQQTFGLTFS